MNNTGSTTIKKNHKHWISKLMYIFLALPALFLLVNEYPYFMVLSVVSIVFLGFLFFLHIKKITSYHYAPILVLVLTYAYFMFSYFFSGQPIANLASYAFLTRDGNFFFCYILFFALAIPFFDYRKVTGYYFKILFFTFTGFACLGFIAYLTGYLDFLTKFDNTAGLMYVGLNFAHNATGSVYALVSICALVFFLQEKRKKIKFAYLAIFLICALALFLTKSRGSYVAFGGTLVFVFWLYFRSVKQVLLSILGLVVVSAPVLWLTGVYERVFQVFYTGGTAAIRFELWEKAWTLFTQSPLLGIGFGRYNDIQVMLTEDLAGRPGFLAAFLNPNFYFDFSHAHNSYLQFLAETGIIGLGLLLIFWALCFKMVLRAYYAAGDTFSKKIFLSAMSGIVLLLLLSFTENYFSATTIMVATSMLVALAMGVAWQEGHHHLEGHA